LLTGVEKVELHSEMAAALKAAAQYADALEALQAQSAVTKEPSRELRERISQTERKWIAEMERHQRAYKRYHNL
jgi:phage shock protein A